MYGIGNTSGSSLNWLNRQSRRIQTSYFAYPAPWKKDLISVSVFIIGVKHISRGVRPRNLFPLNFKRGAIKITHYNVQNDELSYSNIFDKFSPCVIHTPLPFGSHLPVSVRFFEQNLFSKGRIFHLKELEISINCSRTFFATTFRNFENRFKIHFNSVSVFSFQYIGFSFSFS